MQLNEEYERYYKHMLETSAKLEEAMSKGNQQVIDLWANIHKSNEEQWQKSKIELKNAQAISDRGGDILPREV